MAVITGTSGNDNLVGTFEDDSITGGAGNDTIDGDGGADTIEGGSGNDLIRVQTGDLTAGEVIDGGGGTDTLQVSGTNSLVGVTVISIETLSLSGTLTLSNAQLGDFDTITGTGTLRAATAGSYSLAGIVIAAGVVFQGSNGADTITGGSNAERIRGGFGRDEISAGGGDDILIINAGESQAGEIYDGGFGIDTLEIDDASLAGVTLISIERLDVSGTVTIEAAQLPGLTTILGSGSLVGAAPGSFDLSGLSLPATVTFFGSGGDDTITGGAGNDRLDPGGGADSVDAGEGNDTVFVNPGDVQAGEVLDGGLGNDILQVTNGTSLVGATILNFETLQMAGAVTVANAQLGAFAAINGSGSLLAASSGTYTLSGALIAAGITFFATDGVDNVKGGGNNERVDLGGGADKFSGGGGNDVVLINLGDVQAGESLNGGSGTDTIILADGASLVGATLKAFEVLQINGDATLTNTQLNRFDSVTGDGRLIAAETGLFDASGLTLAAGIELLGTAGDDTLRGGSAAEVLEGGPGADVIEAGDGNDTVVVGPEEAPVGEVLDGGAGNDTLEVEGGTSLADAVISNFERLDMTGTVTLTAAQLAGFDSVIGSGTLQAAAPGTYDLGLVSIATNITFAGSNGNDRIIGSAIVNRINGGTGTDTIVLSKGGVQGDIITGFEGAGLANGDVLELVGFGAGATFAFVSGTTYRITDGADEETLSITTIGGAQVTAADVVFV
jgi:Ca2+-binding RTX toxin-like protein